MIPDSLKRVLARKSEPKGDLTTIWRDGTVCRERHNGRLEQLPSIDPLPDLEDDNPFPP